MSKSGGWSEKLANIALDHRKPAIDGFENVNQVIGWIKQKIEQ
jgi:hypothetical protein